MLQSWPSSCIANNHTTDIESAPPPPHLCMSIHPQGESYSDVGRVLVLVLNDPAGRRTTRRRRRPRTRSGSGSAWRRRSSTWSATPSRRSACAGRPSASAGRPCRMPLSPRHPMHVATSSLKLSVGSGVEDMVSIQLEQSELSVSKIPPTDSPEVRPGRDP